jgi:hypothetical protein
VVRPATCPFGYEGEVDCPGLRFESLMGKAGQQCRELCTGDHSNRYTNVV